MTNKHDWPDAPPTESEQGEALLYWFLFLCGTVVAVLLFLAIVVFGPMPQ